MEAGTYYDYIGVSEIRPVNAINGVIVIPGSLTVTGTLIANTTGTITGAIRTTDIDTPLPGQTLAIGSVNASIVAIDSPAVSIPGTITAGPILTSSVDTIGAGILQLGTVNAINIVLGSVNANVVIPGDLLVSGGFETTNLIATSLDTPGTGPFEVLSIGNDNADVISISSGPSSDVASIFVGSSAPNLQLVRIGTNSPLLQGIILSTTAPTLTMGINLLPRSIPPDTYVYPQVIPGFNTPNEGIAIERAATVPTNTPILQINGSTPVFSNTTLLVEIKAVAKDIVSGDGAFVVKRWLLVQNATIFSVTESFEEQVGTGTLTPTLLPPINTDILASGSGTDTILFTPTTLPASVVWSGKITIVQLSL